MKLVGAGEFSLGQVLGFADLGESELKFVSCAIVCFAELFCLGAGFEKSVIVNMLLN
jgi:hypothetical protein